MNLRLLALALLLCSCSKAPLGQVAVYDWEPGQPLPIPEAKALKKSRAQVWLKTARIEAGPQGAWSENELGEETLASYAGLSITACLRFERSSLKALPTGDMAAWAGMLGRSHKDLVERAKKAGVTVVGLQLDLDAPTSQLSAYAKLLQALRAQLASGQGLGITCLPTWFRHPWSFRDVARQSDYLVPLYFGEDIPSTLTNLPALLSLSPLERTAAWAWLYGKPVYAGLPIYSQALVYSAGGMLLNAKNDLNYDDLRSQAAMHLHEAKADGAGSSSRLEFIVDRSCVLKGLQFQDGYRVVWQVADAASLRQGQALARAKLKGSFAGVALYRLDKDDGQRGLLYEAAFQALTSPVQAKPSLYGELEVKQVGKRRWRCVARLMNPTLFPTRAWPRPGHLRVRIKGGSFGDVSPGAFDNVGWGQGFEEDLKASSLLRANTLDFEFHVAPAYQSIESGPIWVDGTEEPMLLYTFVEAPSSQEAQSLRQEDRQVYPFVEAAVWAQIAEKKP